VNILPFLLGERSGDPHEYLFWRMKSRDIWAVRHGDDKLMLQQYKSARLFNLADDIGETTDLAKPELRDALQKAYDAWAATLPEPLWGSEEDHPAPKPELKE